MRRTQKRRIISGKLETKQRVVQLNRYAPDPPPGHGRQLAWTGGSRQNTGSYYHEKLEDIPGMTSITGCVLLALGAREAEEQQRQLTKVTHAQHLDVDDAWGPLIGRVREPLRVLCLAPEFHLLGNLATHSI